MRLLDSPSPSDELSRDQELCSIPLQLDPFDSERTGHKLDRS